MTEGFWVYCPICQKMVQSVWSEEAVLYYCPECGCVLA